MTAGHRVRLTWLAAVAIAPLVASCEDRAQQATPPPPPAVGVIAAERRPVAADAGFVGRVVAVDQVELRARVSGFLAQRLFVEGQDVAAGAPLFVIEQAPYQAELEQKQAALARAEAERKNAQLQLERGRELLRNNNIAAATVDERAAREAVTQAEVLQAQAAVRQAEINFSYTEIHAPIAGRVGRASFTTGNFVGPDSGSLALIVSQDPIYVTFPVHQRLLLEHRGQQTEQEELVVRVRLADDSLYPLPGKLNFVDVQVDRGTDTVAVRSEFPNPERLLIDGQFVRVSVERKTPELALTVPQAALQLDQAGPFVLVVDPEKKVVVRRIAIGRAREGQVVVENGLREGEMVLVDGVQKVRPGQVVSPSVIAQAPKG
jgi:membrane fusion protein, multidrug efflux system